jgi:hypothetical protein
MLFAYAIPRLVLSEHGTEECCRLGLGPKSSGIYFDWFSTAHQIAPCWLGYVFGLLL